MYRVFLGLGSNLGDRLKHMNDAVHEIALVGTIMAISSVYESEPYHMSSEHKFLNAAVELTTSLGPPELLHKLRLIEHRLGRASHTHMKDRKIDIDMLLYDNFYYEEHTGHFIEVPHPDLANRRFALTSLRDIAPAVLHPIEGESIDALLRRCTDHGSVERTPMQLQSPLT